MTHIDLILPVCGLILIVYLIIRIKMLLTDMVANLGSDSSPIKIMLQIAAILVVIAGGAALGYAAFWLVVSVVYRALTS